MERIYMMKASVLRVNEEMNMGLKWFATCHWGFAKDQESSHLCWQKGGMQCYQVSDRALIKLVDHLALWSRIGQC